MNGKRTYKAEYARSDRSICKDKDCSRKIANEELRLASITRVCIFEIASFLKLSSKLLDLFESQKY